MLARTAAHRFGGEFDLDTCGIGQRRGEVDERRFIGHRKREVMQAQTRLAIKRRRAVGLYLPEREPQCPIRNSRARVAVIARDNVPAQYVHEKCSRHAQIAHRQAEVVEAKCLAHDQALLRIRLRKADQPPGAKSGAVNRPIRKPDTSAIQVGEDPNSME